MLQSIAARRLRCRAGPGAALVAAAHRTLGSTPVSPIRPSSWSTSWCGARTRSAAAASSIASGIPSSRRQIFAARAALVGVASISGRLTAARARNRATAGLRMSSSGSASVSGGTGSGSTHTTRSRGTPIAIRLVARIVRPGVRARRSASAGAAERTCSTVSRTSRLGARPSASASDSMRVRPGSSGTPIAPAMAGTTSEASLTPSSGTNATRPSRRTSALRVTSTASRLLPTPPMPASVTNVRSRPMTSRRIAARSASRPISGASGDSATAPGQHGSTRDVRGAWSRGPGLAP